MVTDEQAQDVIPNLPEIYDEPFADSSQIPTQLVCRAARDHVTVALSGDAGDELFGGYNRYLHGPALWSRLSKLPAPVRRAAGQAACGLPEAAWDKLGAVYNRLKPGSGGVANLGTKAHRFGERLRDTHCLEDLYLNAASTWLDPKSILSCSVMEPKSALSDPLPLDALSDPAAWMMAQDLRSYLPGDILCKVDRAAMSVSLETRAPFLEPDVIALSMRLPMEMKIRDGQGKWALRQVLYKYVPQDIIERPKVGFAVPIGHWLRGPLREGAEEMLSEERIARDGFFDQKTVRETWAEHLSGRKDRMPQLWAILMFQAWYTHWYE
jgi:asparagine synthase (glutamine-hydrolysing)